MDRWVGCNIQAPGNHARQSHHVPAERGGGMDWSGWGHCVAAALSASNTASAWPGTLTGCHDRAMTPSGSIRYVLRTMPMTLRPYMFFSRITPKALHSASSLSLTRSNLKPCLAQKFWCDLTESRETPSTVAPSLRNFGSSALKSMPSVVQPGVLSLG